MWTQVGDQNGAARMGGWQAIDRKMVPANEMGPGISDASKEKIRSFFPRYPSKRAVMLPALHIAQDELGYVSLTAMRQIAELLELPPAAVMDVVTFYTAFWTHPKGEKQLMLCRSLTCELLGADKLRERIEQKLGIKDHQTTKDGKFSFMIEECLAACDHGPCLMVNEKMHKCVTPEKLDQILNDPHSDRLDQPRSDLYDAPVHNRQHHHH
jgi:NADH-quinone oxidoreductase subunit E